MEKISEQYAAEFCGNIQNQKSRRWGDIFPDSHSWKTFIMLHMKSNKNGDVKNKNGNILAA